MRAVGAAGPAPALALFAMQPPSQGGFADLLQGAAGEGAGAPLAEGEPLAASAPEDEVDGEAVAEELGLFYDPAAEGSVDPEAVDDADAFDPISEGAIAELDFAAADGPHWGGPRVVDPEAPFDAGDLSNSLDLYAVSMASLAPVPADDLGRGGALRRASPPLVSPASPTGAPATPLIGEASLGAAPLSPAAGPSSAKASGSGWGSGAASPAAVQAPSLAIAPIPGEGRGVAPRGPVIPARSGFPATAPIPGEGRGAAPRVPAVAVDTLADPAALAALVAPVVDRSGFAPARPGAPAAAPADPAPPSSSRVDAPEDADPAAIAAPSTKAGASGPGWSWSVVTHLARAVARPAPTPVAPPRPARTWDSTPWFPAAEAAEAPAAPPVAAPPVAADSLPHAAAALDETVDPAALLALSPPNARVAVAAPSAPVATAFAPAPEEAVDLLPTRISNEIDVVVREAEATLRVHLSAHAQGLAVHVRAPEAQLNGLVGLRAEVETALGDSGYDLDSFEASADGERGEERPPAHTPSPSASSTSAPAAPARGDSAVHRVV